MGSPAEYILQLESDLRATKAALSRAERDLEDERAEYQEKLRNLRGATADAAGTAVIAIERLQKHEAIVEAARRWYRFGSEYDLRRLMHADANDTAAQS